LEEFAGAAGDDVDDAARKIAGFKNLIEVAGNQRIGFRGNGDDGIAGRDQGQHKREESKQRILVRADDTDSSERLVHGHRSVAEWRIVHRAIELVGPARVREKALDAFLDFAGSLFLPYRSAEPGSDFLAALGEILGDVIEDLRAIVSGGFAPGFGF